MLESGHCMVSDEEQDTEWNEVGEQAGNPTGLENRFVHLFLLECVAEDQASEPDQSEQNGPGSSGKQNYLCGIGKHLNPPARHA